MVEIDEKKHPNGVPSNTYGEFVWQGIVFRRRTTHLNDEKDWMKSGLKAIIDISSQ